MKLIFTDGEYIECSKAVRGLHSIYLYSEQGVCINSIVGITDFTNFTLEGGDWEYTDTDKTWKELYEEQKVINDEHDELLAELIEQ